MTAVEAQWTPAKHLILGDDPQLRVYGEISVWYKKIELFRKGEDERMYLLEPTPEDLAVHKSLIQRLIADGEHLLSLVHQVRLPENIEGITPESVAISLDLLRSDYRGWHEPMPAEQRERILKQVFPMSRNPLIEAIHEAHYDLETTNLPLSEGRVTRGPF